MKVEIKESLKVGERSFKAPVLIYENWDEVTKAAGSVEKPVDRLNGFLHAHGSAGELRDLIATIVEEVSGVKPNVKDTGRKNAKGEPITEQEKEAVYVTRVISAQPELFDKVQALLDQRARGYTYKNNKGEEVKVPALAVDISTRVAAPKGPKTLAAKWKEIATNFLAGKINPKSGKPYNLGNLNKEFKKYSVAEFAPVGEPNTPANIEALGWLCKAYSDAKDAFSSL